MFHDRVKTNMSGTEPVSTESPGMRVDSSKRQDGPPRKQGRRNVCSKAGRRRRLTRESLGPPGGGPVERDCRVPTAGSRAFIQDAGRGAPPSLMIDQVMRPL